MEDLEIMGLGFSLWGVRLEGLTGLRVSSL